MNRLYDILIVGGGIVGCSLAKELGRRFDRVLVLEKENGVAFHTSGRNSGVIHSGFNQKPGTLKAQLCVDGNRQTRAYCKERQIPCEEVGTYVVATREEELPSLHQLKAKGDKNGVPGIEILSIEEVRRREPNVKGLAALFSPTGAIVDSVKFAQALRDDAERLGVGFGFGEEVMHIKERKDEVKVSTNRWTYQAQLLINCAGLHADRLAHLMKVGREYMINPFRGEYFVVGGKSVSIINSMIYPVPNPEFPFLGVHLTKTIAGSILIGPNAVPAFGREAYSKWSFNLKDFSQMIFHRGLWKALRTNRLLREVAWSELKNSCSKKHFLKEASRLVDGLRLEDLTLAKRVGIRAQLIRSDGQFQDDLVVETTRRSIHLLNVVSPGMTSALPFAQWLSKGIADGLYWRYPRQEAAA
ncbi:MAG: L-2-hydroxyglutarate oxidase [Chlamydiae bacterium]|nr:L-2-hydroxyglutarate oxidase [Chlamydiota bacterium]MBI3277977.1 L-2-hydroxyglutarate oxidase [Chlamydiota bacterium]